LILRVPNTDGPILMSHHNADPSHESTLGFPFVKLFIKTLKPFVLGKFDVDDQYLQDNGVNRTGNIMIPNDRYVDFERFMRVFLARLYDMQMKEGKVINSKDFVYEIGRELELQNNPNKEESICYWCYKNNIPYFCPALTDGSLGDMIYFFKQQRPDFKIDITDDIVTINNIALNSEKTGVISLGGSLPKHHICNANMFREGADFAVYITTAHEGDGSNAGASPSEAVSWGKIKALTNTIKVEGDATILFPLIIAGSLLE